MPATDHARIPDRVDNALDELVALEKAVPLWPEDLPRIENRSGIYAAWIAGRRAQREAALKSGTPELLYVGKGKDLRRRLRRHVPGGLPGLTERLASRGTILFPFGHYYMDPNGRMAARSALLDLSRGQSQDWQCRNLRWTWSYCDHVALDRIEASCIRGLSPLLNTTYSGLGPLALRGFDEAARANARWLWHASWAVWVLWDRLGDMRSMKQQQRWRHPKLTSGGFLIPADRATGDDPDAPVPKLPSARAIRKMLDEAVTDASDEIRAAARQTDKRKELQVWWAMHAGAPFLPEPVSVIEAMRASLLLLSESEAPCPTEIPSAGHREDLARLAAGLGGVAD